jgi:hypothetical protein
VTLCIITCVYCHSLWGDHSSEGMVLILPHGHIAENVWRQEIPAQSG